MSTLRPLPVTIAAFIAACAALVSGSAHAQAKAVEGHEPPNACGPIYAKWYGPYDYRNERSHLGVVEIGHFTPEVEAGLHGSTSAYIGEDLNYTLRASPNHHRALVTLTRVAEGAPEQKLPGMTWPLECYYDRALRFRPDDLIVRMLYAEYLLRQKRQADAMTELGYVAANAGDDPMTHFNLGMIYTDAGDYDKAVSQAHIAADLGDPRQDLIARIKSAGHWTEAAASAASAASGAMVDAAATVAPAPSAPASSGATH